MTTASLSYFRCEMMVSWQARVICATHPHICCIHAHKHTHTLHTHTHTHTVYMINMNTHNMSDIRTLALTQDTSTSPGFHVNIARCVLFCRSDTSAFLSKPHFEILGVLVGEILGVPVGEILGAPVGDYLFCSCWRDPRCSCWRLSLLC